MDIKTIQALTQAYNAVLEKACGSKRAQAEANMDAVDQGELKGSHADRKDKDINNDGKVTSTDKYLHKRRKAVSKAIKNKGETATMNPKMDNEKSEQKESTEMSIRDKLVAVLEKKHGNVDNKQEYDDQDSPGAKKMRDDNKDPGTYNDLERQSHDDAAKAGRATKPSAKNPTDKDAKGDKSVVNPVKDTTKVGKGDPVMKESVLKERKDTAHHIAKTLRKMGVRHDAKEHEILPKIPHALKKHGLHNDKLIKRDRDFQGDVIDSLRGMKESVMKESFTSQVKSIAGSYQSMYKEVSEEESNEER